LPKASNTLATIARASEASRRVHSGRRILIDELVRKNHAAYAQAAIEQPVQPALARRMNRSLNGAFLNCDQYPVRLRKLGEQLNIERQQSAHPQPWRTGQVR
jgi:hypothetical protein